MKPTRYGMVGGVAVLALGQVLVIAGILMPVLFLPGVFLIGLGLVLLAAFGLIMAWSDRTAQADRIAAGARDRV